MLSYEYIARNTSNGQKVKAMVQADNEQDASKLIRQEGLSPISITLKELNLNGINKYLHRVKTKDKVLFSRQLSTLLNAGLPLLQSLRNVVNQTQNKNLKIVLDNIITSVEGGSAFSASLAKHPTVFNRVFVSLVAAGEASGTLDKALERLANQQEKDAEILSKVRGAMIYPAVVLLVMIAVVGFIIIKVLPQVQIMYEGIPGANLPFITKVLLGVSKFIIKFWLVILIVIGLGVFLLSRWARTGGGEQIIDKAKMKIWPIGQLFMKMYMARFARTGQTLVASGVPLIQMLEITGDAISNVHVEKSLQKATEKVKGGKSLSTSLTGDPNFLELVPNMLAIGEQSGSLEEMMGKIADYYEREVEREINNIQTLVEPIMMVGLGLVAFGIVAAILLPIYGLAGQTIIK